VFQKYDTARNGVISFDEFTAALHDSDISDEDLKEIFESMDVNKNGHINYTGTLKNQPIWCGLA